MPALLLHGFQMLRKFKSVGFYFRFGADLVNLERKGRGDFIAINIHSSILCQSHIVKCSFDYAPCPVGKGSVTFSLPWCCWLVLGCPTSLFRPCPFTCGFLLAWRSSPPIPLVKSSFSSSQVADPPSNLLDSPDRK